MWFSTEGSCEKNGKYGRTDGQPNNSNTRAKHHRMGGAPLITIVCWMITSCN